MEEREGKVGIWLGGGGGGDSWSEPRRDETRTGEETGTDRWKREGRNGGERREGEVEGKRSKKKLVRRAEAKGEFPEYETNNPWGLSPSEKRERRVQSVGECV